MYRLFIKPLDGTEFIQADFGKDTPRINYEVSDIAELENKSANYSQRLTLPLTNTNRRIFGYINSPNSASKTPYSLLPARLYFKQTTLVGKGGLCKVLQVNGTSVEICLLSGNKNISELLEAVDFGTSGVFGTPIMPEAYEPDELTSDRNDYIFADYKVSDDKWLSQSIDGFTQSAMPLLWFWHNGQNGAKGLIPTLFDSIGYQVRTNIDTSELNDLALSLCEPKNNNASLEFGAETFVRSISIKNEDELTNNVICNQELLSVVQRANLQGVVVTCTATAGSFIYANLAFNFGGVVSSDNSNQAKYTLLNHDDEPPSWSYYRWQKVGNNYQKKIMALNDGRVFETDENGVYFDSGISFDIDKEFKIGDKVQVLVDNSTILRGADIRLTTSVQFLATTDNDDAIAGGRIDVAKSLGWKNGNDAVKNVCQLLGLSLHVEEDEKVVTIYNLSILRENIANAVDWSDKLQSGVQRTFNYGDYSQHNFISFNENERTNRQDKLDIPIDNSTLTDSKELFTIPIESGDGVVIDQLNDAGTQFKKTKKPHLVHVEKRQDGDYSVYAHAHAQEFAPYYSAVGKMLNNNLTITAKFRLTEQDIATLNFMHPVFLRQFGRFFYLNSVKNYNAHETTECALVSI